MKYTDCNGISFGEDEANEGMSDILKHEKEVIAEIVAKINKKYYNIDIKNVEYMMDFGSIAVMFNISKN